jgi:hypothetical protein
MSAKGQSRTFGAVRRMSGLPSIADIERTSRDVRVVPARDIAAPWAVVQPLVTVPPDIQKPRTTKCFPPANSDKILEACPLFSRP